MDFAQPFRKPEHRKRRRGPHQSPQTDRLGKTTNGLGCLGVGTFSGDLLKRRR